MKKDVSRPDHISEEDWKAVSHNPEWTAERVAAARPFAEVFPQIAAGIKRGRPPKARPKQQVAIRLDADVIDHFRAGGPGWHVRINEALRKAAGL